MKAIKLTDVHMMDNGGWESEQYSSMTPNGLTGMSDNGGQPHGSEWIIWNTTDEDTANAVALGAEVINVYQADFQEEPWTEVISQFASGSAWSGVGSHNEAVFVEKRDAELCQRCHDIWNDFDHGGDLDTIAYLVNTEKDKWVLTDA